MEKIKILYIQYYWGDVKDYQGEKTCHKLYVSHWGKTGGNMFWVTNSLMLQGFLYISLLNKENLSEAHKLTSCTLVWVFSNQVSSQLWSLKQKSFAVGKQHSSTQQHKAFQPLLQLPQFDTEQSHSFPLNSIELWRNRHAGFTHPVLSFSAACAIACSPEFNMQVYFSWRKLNWVSESIMSWWYQHIDN